MKAAGTCVVALSALASAACQKPAPAYTDTLSAARLVARDSGPFEEVRETVRDRYEHRKDVRALLDEHAEWFTPALVSLMRADLSGDAIGVIDADPFTDAQDIAEGYEVGNARLSHDTVFVSVAVRFDSTFEASSRLRNVTLAMVRASTGWQIADFVSGGTFGGSLADRLRREASAAVDSSTKPDSISPDSTKADSAKASGNRGSPVPPDRQQEGHDRPHEQ